MRKEVLRQIRTTTRLGLLGLTGAVALYSQGMKTEAVITGAFSLATLGISGINYRMERLGSEIGETKNPEYK